MKPFVFLLSAAVLWTSVAPAADPPILARYFHVLPSIVDFVTVVDTAKPGDFIVPRGYSGSAAELDCGLQKFFEGRGVSFPPGSSLSYQRSISRIVLRNTSENIEAFGRVLMSINVLQSQVEVDVSFVAFDLKLIEGIARRSDRGAVSGEEIKSLWREGKGRLVGTSEILTPSGVNAQSKGVGEVIYPTEFKTGRGTNSVTGASDPVPGAFETREAGIIVDATPTVGPDGCTIHLIFAPEFCELLFWDNVGFEKIQPRGKGTSIQLRQPRFHSRNLTTAISVQDGETLVAGGMPNGGNTEITYLFVTARMLDPAGRPLRESGQAGGRFPASDALAAGPPMVTRSYRAHASLFNELTERTGRTRTLREDRIGSRGQSETAATLARDLRDLFEKRGVPFPAGSDLSLDATGAQMVLRNVPVGIEIFERVLAALASSSNLAEIDVSFVAFDLKTIETAARGFASAAVSGEEINSLWRHGKGRLVGTSKVLAQHGVNVHSKGVDEVLYPTEFGPSQGTNGVVTADDPLPGSFETREVGLVVNATPTVRPDGYTIDLTFVPEFCELPFQDDVGFEKTLPDGKKTSLQLRQPRFHSRNLAVEVVLWDGETLVAGAMPNSGVTEITYVFVTARLLDPSGRPVNTSDTAQGLPAPAASQSSTKPAK